MPADLMFASAYPKEELGVSEYVQNLVKSLKGSHHVARKNLKEAQKNMKRNYDLRILERNYKEGDVVYALDNTAIKGKSRKLSAPWNGPGIILEKITSYLFRAQIRNEVMVVNHDRMKRCLDKQLSAWLVNFNPLISSLQIIVMEITQILIHIVYASNLGIVIS